MRNKNDYSASDHTFAICAYKENPYLEDCILSVLDQTILGNVILSTSTPNAYIKGLAQKYDLPLYINEGKGNMEDNFNFALSKAETPFVTLCHQDDYFHKTYLEEVIKLLNKSQNALILFTDYIEDRNHQLVEKNTLLKIKRIVSFPLRFRVFWKSEWVRRRILSVCNPICCPSVTYHKEAVPGKVFDSGFSSSIDWKCWEKLSRLDGQFIYCPKKLVYHRIWEGSETTATIQNSVRMREDQEILRLFWPEPIANIILRVYSTSEKSNQL